MVSTLSPISLLNAPHVEREDREGGQTGTKGREKKVRQRRWDAMQVHSYQYTLHPNPLLRHNIAHLLLSPSPKCTGPKTIRTEPPRKNIALCAQKTTPPSPPPPDKKKKKNETLVDVEKPSNPCHISTRTTYNPPRSSEEKRLF